jgi:hypothetical protein
MFGDLVEAIHQLTAEADNGDEIVFVCHELDCGRRLVLKRSGGLVVLDRGDFFARHVGGSEGLMVTAAIGS